MPLLALKNARAAAEDGYRTLAALGREEAQQRERTIHRWTYPTYQSVASWRTADIQARVSPPNSGPVSICMENRWPGCGSSHLIGAARSAWG